MSTFASLLDGFSIALTYQSLLFCLLGVTIGTAVGVLPGIGPTAAISLALPVTFYLEPVTALIMLSGIFYGAQYGGSITAILLNLPGEPSSAVTCLDAYPLTRQGRAGAALFISVAASFVGGSIAIIVLILFAPALAEFAKMLAPADYFSVMLLGLVSASTLSVGSPLKGLTMVVFGVALGTVGTDITTGTARFTFGIPQLRDGFDVVAVAMGLFGVAEILSNLVSGPGESVHGRNVSLRSMIPTRKDIAEGTLATGRGSVIGSLVGILPGAGPTIAAFMAYALEVRVARDPSRFGRGAIEGVASPEAANNAAVQASFIPALSLGIPGNAVMAVMLGAMMIHGIVPGPLFVSNHPDIFWGVVASFWIGNILLVFLNIPLVGIWVRLLSVPYNIMYPAMLFFICIGVYSVRNSVFDIAVAAGFGLLGFFMLLYKFPAAPVLLGFVLGPMVEENFKRTLLLSRGDFLVFFERPVSLVLLIVTGVFLLLSLRSLVKSFARK